jgi:hypothetical protein
MLLSRNVSSQKKQQNPKTKFKTIGKLGRNFHEAENLQKLTDAQETPVFYGTSALITIFSKIKH